MPLQLQPLMQQIYMLNSQFTGLHTGQENIKASVSWSCAELDRLKKKFEASKAENEGRFSYIHRWVISGLPLMLTLARNRLTHLHVCSQYGVLGV